MSAHALAHHAPSAGGCFVGTVGVPPAGLAAG